MRLYFANGSAWPKDPTWPQTKVYFINDSTFQLLARIVRRRKG